MRSLSFTLLLIFLALVGGGLATLRLAEGNLSRIFGAPPTAIGEPLYDFDAGQTRVIGLRGNGVSAYCKLTDDGWWVDSPWNDRMDPRVAQSILTFTLGARVEGAIPTDKIESANVAFDDGRIDVRIGDVDQEALAKFRLGHRTPWLGIDPETGENIPTIFVEPRDRSRKDYTYACTDPGDIHALLTDGFKRVRDHHPFKLNRNVETIRIKNRVGELQLAFEPERDHWKISKPLDLKTDREAMVRLLQGLLDLEAINVFGASEVTLPTVDPEALDQIALQFYGSTEEVVLEIHPPETPESPTVFARVSDRPNAVFELLRTAVPSTGGEKAPVSLADLPLSVNDLRDPTLTSINPRQVRTIVIASAADENILISREHPSHPPRVKLDGRFQIPNATALAALMSVVTEGRVTGFVTDTATDLSAYGLNAPFLSLRFIGFDDGSIQLDFGQNKDGETLAMRKGSTTVVKIDPAMLGLIPLEVWQWRDTKLWDLSKYNILSIERLMRDTEPLRLEKLNPVLENWVAKQGGEDRTAELATDRADRFLDHLTGLHALDWLKPDHPGARAALADPDIVIKILSRQFDASGNDIGVQEQQLTIGSTPVGDSRIAYGSIEGQPHPFTIRNEGLELLGVDLFGFD